MSPLRLRSANIIFVPRAIQGIRARDGSKHERSIYSSWNISGNMLKATSETHERTATYTVYLQSKIPDICIEDPEGP